MFHQTDAKGLSQKGSKKSVKDDPKGFSFTLFCRKIEL
jgi:hypothetical protein